MMTNPYYKKNTEFYIKALRVGIVSSMIMIFIQFFITGFNTSFIGLSAMTFSVYHFTNYMRKSKIFIGFSLVPYYLMIMPFLYMALIYNLYDLDKVLVDTASHVIILFLAPIFFSFFYIIRQLLNMPTNIETIKEGFNLQNEGSMIVIDFRKDLYYTQIKNFKFNPDGLLMVTDEDNKTVLSMHAADIIRERKVLEGVIGKNISEFSPDDILMAEMYMIT